jgi:hypothetical protein
MAPTRSSASGANPVCASALDAGAAEPVRAALDVAAVDVRHNSLLPSPDRAMPGASRCNQTAVTNPSACLANSAFH